MDDEVTAVRAAVPEARRPDRHRRISGFGVGLAVWEWGDEDATPVLFAHGGFDFAGTLDVFAPMLAAAGRRVISWDMRGHGDSDHSHLYSWDSDVRDAMAVFDSIGPAPVDVIGHSKGGNLMVQLADAQPHRFRRMVNLDGIPSGANAPDVSERDRTRLLSGELTGWLDHRRGLAGKQRRPDTLDGLAQRRAKMNPRLPIEWLRYLVTVGGRKDADGWRWKTDTAIRFGGFGPRRPEWGMLALSGLGMPFLGILATVTEEMGWGTTPAYVGRHLPRRGELVQLDGVGHFVHIEQPTRVAELALDFLGR
jgi:pimeloyl-ACP methyl ester carboxylesterase